ncbi:MAG TPA: RNA 2',3'-cyclic phosphodiesterase [Anaerolineales bacterium]|nr:RNA 2',3'-cyclic phosphodiesterase [Anaerolineales bacterium]
MSVIRAFIAISVSEEIYGRLDNIIFELKERLPDSPLRWVPTRNIHLTIKFLGNVSEANLEVLKNTLQREISSNPSFEISVGRFGAFPSVNRPRVLWVGMEAPKQLFIIQAGVENLTTRLGYPKEERPLSPHLTLARVARNASPQEVRSISQTISGYEVGFLGAFRVGEIHLYRSDLQSSGAVYTRLFSVRLQ